MVTRVDKKPIIYNTSLLRCIRPSVVCASKPMIEHILGRAKGYRIPDASARDILDDYDDIEAGMRMFGVNDPAYEVLTGVHDEGDDETIRIARSLLHAEDNIRKALRSEAMMEEVVKLQRALFKDAEAIYFGTEAVYALLGEIAVNNVFHPLAPSQLKMWATQSAQRIMCLQSPYLFIHPSAVGDMCSDMGKQTDATLWPHWDRYKKTELLALRVVSRKNLLAHSALYGINRRGFVPSEDPLDDFKIDLHSEVGYNDSFSLHLILGMKYYRIGSTFFVLSADDCINMASMAQCLFRNCMYYLPANGYSYNTHRAAISLANDILLHCRRLIDSNKNFSHIIRSMHILAQGDFNDAYEKEMGVDLGWEVRSANYVREAKQLDPMGVVFNNRAKKLANCKLDELNTGFIYHCFVGDEMLISDLHSKVENMPTKVLPADKDEWSRFISFCKTYFLCRFMMVNSRKPKAGGDVKLLNEVWAERCVKGMFTMPPQSDWGKVYISGEFNYSRFADTWHLEAQDVSYVMKDSQGVLNDKYRGNRCVGSELLMAMTSGSVLDVKAGSTPNSARERIIRGEPCSEVVLTTAPKAENAKPSWKKRVTFAADCEFRKMQAEYDRNCRKIMSFVRGPSLGVDQCILEKQFADIAKATSLGVSGGICSHDISAWSESMNRDRKFEFEGVLTEMLDCKGMENISLDWGKIRALVTKQGSKKVVELRDGSFQGFDGSASTLLHSMILLYCIDTARRKNVMPVSVKTNMATLIDDCIALMEGLTNQDQALGFWEHLKKTYLSLGFEIDDLKSIFSTIKAIYLSRRFINGGEVPADYKVFIKTHVSYEDPLRCSLDAVSDIMGSLRGAADANGNVWFIYYAGVLSAMAEIASYNPVVMKLPPAAAAVFALAPTSDNGWGVPSILSWSTNDVTDKVSHFNAILESAANHANAPKSFQGQYDIYPKSVGLAVMALKSQAWRVVSYSNIFTNPFDSVREGPMKPDMLKRNAIQDILRDVATASPWVELLKWNVSQTTDRVRQLLVNSGPLHAPTLAALVNCMPDNYRLSLVGKAVGSQSVLDLLPKGRRSSLKRRVLKCSAAFFEYSHSIFSMTKKEYTSEDYASLNYAERTQMERAEFFTANGCTMIDHTFPDPLYTFTVTATRTGSVISPNTSSLMPWDKTTGIAVLPKQYLAPKGIYVPRRSSRVWEITSEYGKGWDSVSQRIAMGLAVLARAESDGHRVEGLLAYFTKSWNEVSNITPRDTQLIAIHGSIKRLDANPGCSTHPVIAHRNLLRGINNKLKSALDAIPSHLDKTAGRTAHLHDFLSHETGMLAATILQLSVFMHLGVADSSLQYHIATRPDCIMPESSDKMSTDLVYDRICIEIMDGADNYGLLQACPELAYQIAIPTMKASWVNMINCLIDGDHAGCEELRRAAYSIPLDELLDFVKDQDVMYTTSVIIASEPALRSTIPARSVEKYAMVPTSDPARTKGDGYTVSVRPVQSKFSRTLSQEQPDYLMAAVAIRSIVWDRLKTKPLMELSAVYYQDPDANTAAVSECATRNFWRGIVVEVNRLRGKRNLSELLMMGLRSLGVPSVHISSSNTVDDVIHSVSSYFGANLRDVTLLVSDQLLAITGRRAGDFSKPLLQKVITNNPSLHNARLRKDHMKTLINYNRDQLVDRVKRITEGKVEHRGDKRSCEINSRFRLVELRCRLYIYKFCEVNEQGQAEFLEEGHAEYIYSCARMVAERLECKMGNLPPPSSTFEGTLRFMDLAEEFFRSDPKSRMRNHGWIAEAGKLGSRLALDTIISDSLQVSQTQFAVAASEVAPRLYKRIIHTAPHVEEQETSSAAEALSAIWEVGSDEEGVCFGDEDDSAFEDITSGSAPKAGMAAWKMLYTLLYTGQYSGETVRNALNVDISNNPDIAELRECHLEDFSDEEVYAAFPGILGTYVVSGAMFEEEWLNRDEADAYTTDELGRTFGAGLF